MDFTRLAVDAGQFINRAVQYTGESLGQADSTELDPGLEELLARVDTTKTWTDKIISQVEVSLQPSLGARLEDRLYEHLEWSVAPRPRAHELLGDDMTQAGLEIGSSTPYGMALIQCGEAQKQLGEAERRFMKSTNVHFLTPLRRFTEGEYRLIQNERKMLVNKRLDLDVAKRRLRKAHEADREARHLNATPVEDDYLSHVSFMFSFLRVKWLKMWAQEISQAEMELRICQSLFDRQTDVTKRVVGGLDDAHTNHMRSLADFVDAQSSYFAECNQHAQELQRQLSRFPAVLCSNNWQSTVNNSVNLPSRRVADDEPLKLDQVTPTTRVLPDINQDSLVINSSPKTDSVSSANMNQSNNNNVSSTQSPLDQSAVKRRLFASQTLDHVFRSIQTEEKQSPSGTSNTCVTATPASDQAVGISGNEDAGGGTTRAASPPSQVSDIQMEPQMENSEADDSLTPSDVGPRPADHNHS
ncbi:endophilin-B1 [Nothobranchius furzeri]|uniref:SH3-domain GRB2-like endophilin B1b n=1 Tax=Nothobranchius furzeri TaxID=105023 RepID=A0A1A8V1U5_NOTFU